MTMTTHDDDNDPCPIWLVVGLILALAMLAYGLVSFWTLFPG